MRRSPDFAFGHAPHAASISGALVLGLLAANMALLQTVPALLATGVFLAAACLVLYLAAGAGVPRRFGAANSVTLVRLALGCLLAGSLLDPGSSMVESGLASALALGILALDGLDGWLARRFGLETTFGGRFDMEVDAAVIAVLCILAWTLGRADAWVLLIGSMRYAFAAAGAVAPWLRAPLPPRRGRRLVCVAQMLALAIALAPWTADQASMVLALALSTLMASFALDVAWLFRNARGRNQT